MVTKYPKEGDIERKWYIVDAQDRVLGRLATKIASILKGKAKVYYSPHIDMGDGVIVINAGKIRLTGKKLTQKEYKRYSGYPGGLKLENAESLIRRKPEEVIRHAVKGMLPKNKLGRRMIKRLKVYSGKFHKHMAQRPIEIKV